MVLFDNNEIQVRLLSESDAPLLAKWLSDPKVLQYYEGRDRPHDLDAVKKHFYDRTQEITQCIIHYEGKDIGYIQIYPITEEERQEYDYMDFDGPIYGMDQFIGETEYWNKGIGAKLVTSMVQYIIGDLGVKKIVMNPQTWNNRALKCYEKCGFIRKRLLPKHEWHEGEMKDCWLIEYEAKEYEVRPTRTEDVRGIQNVAQKTWLETYKGIYPVEFIHNFLNQAYSDASLENSIKRDMDSDERKFLVALNEHDEIVGYSHAMIQGDGVYELLRIYVLPGYQGKGIGELLIEGLKNRISNLVVLKAWVEKDNSVGRRFYENKGFQAVEEKEETLEGLTTKLICYELRL